MRELAVESIVENKYEGIQETKNKNRVYQTENSKRVFRSHALTQRDAELNHAVFDSIFI
jgi:hypothetical protein